MRADKKRAPKGSVAHHVLLRLPEDVDEHARAAAKRAGKSYAQWLREAVAAAVLREASTIWRDE